MSVAMLPGHVAPPRIPFTPRHHLQPHERRSLKPLLVPLLPADAEVRVYSLTETSVVVGATLRGRRLTLTSRCPSQIYPAADWAAEVARNLLNRQSPGLAPASDGCPP